MIQGLKRDLNYIYYFKLLKENLFVNKPKKGEKSPQVFRSPCKIQFLKIMNVTLINYAKLMLTFCHLVNDYMIQRRGVSVLSCENIQYLVTHYLY